ncbi:MAG: MBL fold metallo-hydrolase [Eubacteriaceae bacterium]|nr:MBL fold metallo-hydrolase [Eubacteriaceae bacterium]
MQLVFGGGALEVGASFLLAKVDGLNIAMDCGVRMEAGNQLPDLSIIADLGGIDVILLSHAHTDHSGALPVLCQEYPSAKVHMTHATKDLIRVLLYDSLKIMDRREAEIPLFSETQVERVFSSIICHSPNRPFSLLEGSQASAEFYSAGHVAGAVGVLVTGDEGKLFYSGDFSLTAQRSVGGAAFPRLSPDVAILEATYGDRLHASREVEEDRLLDTVIRVVERGGKLLIPAFSLGRSQEVIMLLNRAFSLKKLPSDLMVYIDGMVNDMCQVFSRNPNYLSPSYGRRILRGQEIFYSDNVVAVAKDQKERERIATSSEPCCIISSSGMLSGGPSVYYAEKLAANENNFIALTGYQDEESPGRALLSLATAKEKSIKIDGREIPVKCEVGLYSLSAHADKIEIASLAQSLNAKQIFLNHGSEEALNSLAAAIQREFPGRVYIPKNGELFTISLNEAPEARRKISLLKVEKPNLGMEGLWSHVFYTYTEKKAFSVEDLMEIGQIPEGEGAFEAFRDELNASKLFVAEAKRPFLYHAALPESNKKAAQPAQMEGNEALLLADKYFGAESGLYKKGLHEGQTIKLYFDFPVAQAKAARPAIIEYEKATGWKVETNDECRPAQAESLIARLIRDDSQGSASLAKSPSYYRDEGSFTASISGNLNNPEAVKRSFEAITGMRLMFSAEKQKAQQSQKPKAVKPSSFQMEQNQALAAIDIGFMGQAHKPYKKGLKMRGSQRGIEVSFITEAVGKRYLSLLEQLQSQTGWEMWINPASNQHELQRAASECLAEYGITAKKLSYMPSTGAVKAALDSPAAASDLKAASESFAEMTGSTLEF